MRILFGFLMLMASLPISALEAMGVAEIEQKYQTEVIGYESCIWQTVKLDSDHEKREIIRNEREILKYAGLLKARAEEVFFWYKKKNECAMGAVLVHMDVRQDGTVVKARVQVSNESIRAIAKEIEDIASSVQFESINRSENDHVDVRFVFYDVRAGAQNAN